MLAIATNSDAKLKRIEMLEKKINALKAERTNIENKCSPILDEMEVLSKRKEALKDKIKKISHNPGVCTSSYFKALLEKAENNIKLLTLYGTYDKLSLDISKINLNIDKANIEIIKAEIKARKTPKTPLDVVKTLIKHTKCLVKYTEANIKAIEAEIKKKRMEINWLEICLEKAIKADEIRKNSNDSYRNTEIAELKVKEAMLKLKLEQARKETQQAWIKKEKISIELCKTCLKVEKVIDKKNLKLYFNHDYDVSVCYET
jgi:chromosome segregation ATPase